MATRPIIKPLADDVMHWNAMVYADPGAGKTVLAGSDLKVLFVAPEKDGLMSAQTLGSRAQRILVPDWETMINTYEWFDENPEDLEPFDVLSIDSVSEMQYLAKDYVLRMGADEKIRKGRDPKKMEIQDYGEMHNLLEEMVRGFNDLAINVLYTATAKMVEGPDKENFLVPDLQGKKDYGIAMKIASLMTFYGYMRVEMHEIPAPTEENDKAYKTVKRRVIYWEDSGVIRAKDRSNKLKPFTLNPTLQQIRRAIKGDMVRNAEGFIVKIDSPAAKKIVAKAADKPKIAAVVSKPKQETDSDDEAKDVAPQTSPEVSDKVESTPEDKAAAERLDRNPETKAKLEKATEEMKEGNHKSLDLDAVDA